MTWKRVATAAVLIPFAVGIVLWGSTAIVALAVALVTLLALFEYFALGEAIGHRAYRFWTATCALVLIYSQWQGNAEHGYVLGLVALERRLRGGPPSLDAAFFLFVLGIAILTLFTKRPMVEGAALCGNQRQRSHPDCIPALLRHPAPCGRTTRPGAAAACDGDYLGGETRRHISWGVPLAGTSWRRI